MKKTMIAAALLLAAGLAAFGAAKAKADKDALQGTWYVAQGVYTDGSLEKELEMQFTFKAATMTNPMADDKEIPWTLDDKAKTITAKDGDSQIWIHYAIVDDATVTFIEMKVTTAKGTTVIVGAKGTFKELDLKRKV
jgi:hypothetical protein